MSPGYPVFLSIDSFFSKLAPSVVLAADGLRRNCVFGPLGESRWTTSAPIHPQSIIYQFSSICGCDPFQRMCGSACYYKEADYTAFGTDSLTRKKNTVLSAVLLRPDPNKKKPPVIISLPKDFRPVSSIIDVDILPETHRRVRLYKHGQEKPLGFYIRDGSSVRVTPQGLEKVPGIFISRLVPGGLAESTGLLAVNDEVLEVNGIEVAGKSLDQVTDMMIANSHNLIVTVKPANQRNNVVRSGGGGAASGSSGRSSDSGASYHGYASHAAAASGPTHIIQNFPVGELESDEDDEDLVIEVGGEADTIRRTSSNYSIPSLPRYEPHLNLRTTTNSSSAFSLNANGTLHGSGSSGSLHNPNASSTTPSPDRAKERRSLEEEGTVITL
ncbi:hypothetical protein XENOCAPTIV_030441 [Xenoophorus captivus]|uniref:PDZ domain-containing protein n=1 Tax=Xenoophorus captivus TaxID=1517983 RepID=A0ABV0R5R6_9TELE